MTVRYILQWASWDDAEPDGLNWRSSFRIHQSFREAKDQLTRYITGTGLWTDNSWSIIFRRQYGIDLHEYRILKRTYTSNIDFTEKVIYRKVVEDYERERPNNALENPDRQP